MRRKKKTKKQLEQERKTFILLASFLILILIFITTTQYSNLNLIRQNASFILRIDDAYNISEITYYVSKVPDQILRNLTIILLNKNVKDLKRITDDQYRVINAGRYNFRLNTVFVFIPLDVGNVIYHEIGHKFYYQQLSEIDKKKHALLYNNSIMFVTRYSSKHIREDFAETFACFINPDYEQWYFYNSVANQTEGMGVGRCKHFLSDEKHDYMKRVTRKFS